VGPTIDQPNAVQPAAGQQHVPVGPTECDPYHDPAIGEHEHVPVGPSQPAGSVYLQQPATFRIVLVGSTIQPFRVEALDPVVVLFRLGPSVEQQPFGKQTLLVVRIVLVGSTQYVQPEQVLG
jgi:hypothetical protein